jgi:hypothetical protein
MTALSMYDEASLDWFFGEGSALFERSTTGPMLERAALFKVDYLPDPELVAAERAREPWDPPVGEITARPTAEVRAPGGHMAPEGAMSRYARISRILRKIGAVDLVAYEVLGTFYGDQGARWGRTVYGRLFGLFPMTTGGRELLVRAREPGRGLDRGLSAAEQLWVLLEVQHVRPMPGIAVLKHKARIQALKAYEHACILWQQAKGEI